jgi:hypothetical protein
MSARSDDMTIHFMGGATLRLLQTFHLMPFVVKGDILKSLQYDHIA